MSLLIHSFSSVAALNYGNILLEVMHNCKKKRKNQNTAIPNAFLLKARTHKVQGRIFGKLL